MTREEAITVIKALIENPIFCNEHIQAFNIAIHDIKQRHDWDINNLILINKDNYESLEQEPCDKYIKEIDHLRKYIYKLETQIVEQEPTTKENLGVGCIDRKEFIDWINTWDITPIIKNPLIRHIQALPSVTPIRPKGHWIDTNNLDVKYKAIYMCSNCRNCYTEMKPINMNFCPNCGADMREVEDDNSREE